MDELNDELEAMQTIARALAGVRDPETRLRILRWTNERFAGAPAAPSTANGARAARMSDPSLSVDGLRLFEDEPVGPAAEPEIAPAAHAPDQPLDSLVRGFATDLRALAVQWQSA